MKIRHHVLVTTFDIVNGKTFFEELDDILEEVELLILSTLTNQPIIKARIGETIGGFELQNTSKCYAKSLPQYNTNNPLLGKMSHHIN